MTPSERVWANRPAQEEYVKRLGELTILFGLTSMALAGCGGDGPTTGDEADIKQKHCSPPVCEIACPNGLKKNSHGCEICECAPLPSCQLPVCEIACGPNGLQKDENGCEICACAPPP